jgi:hypothetical protein
VISWGYLFVFGAKKGANQIAHQIKANSAPNDVVIA